MALTFHLDIVSAEAPIFHRSSHQVIVRQSRRALHTHAPCAVVGYYDVLTFDKQGHADVYARYSCGALLLLAHDLILRS